VRVLFQNRYSHTCLKKSPVYYRVRQAYLRYYKVFYGVFTKVSIAYLTVDFVSTLFLKGLDDSPLEGSMAGDSRGEHEARPPGDA